MQNQTLDSKLLMVLNCRIHSFSDRSNGNGFSIEFTMETPKKNPIRSELVKKRNVFALRMANIYLDTIVQ